MPYTIKLIQPDRKKSVSDKIPIYLRLYQDGRLIHINTGIYVEPKYFNDGRGRIRATHDKQVMYNNELERLENLAESKALELKRINKLDIELIRDFLDGGGKKNLIEYAESYQEELRENGRYYERRNFRVVINDLKKFVGTNCPQIGSVDTGFIEDFQNYLLHKKSNGKLNNPNTTRRKLKRLKAMFSHALKRKVIIQDPFRGFEMVRGKPADRVKLSGEQIKAIEKLELDYGSTLWHVRNYFMYSFYNAGIRFSDLCTLTWGCLVDGRLEYQMHKTSGRKSIKQLEPMLKILDYYRSAEAGDEDYIFSILDRKYSNPNSLRKKISSKNVIVNRGLKDIAKLAGINANVSFHVSRHSFSQYALKEGLNLYQISKALGHSSLSTTEQYLKAFDEELLDKGMNQMFG